MILFENSKDEGWKEQSVGVIHRREKKERVTWGRKRERTRARERKEIEINKERKKGIEEELNRERERGR